MRSLKTFLFEWKHFVGSPFKILAVLLFIIASMYGLHNGADLYHKQNAEIERINEEVETKKATILSYFKNNEKGPSEHPWVDITTPFWAIYNTPTYHFKNPSPTLVYNIGQTEQYGFYKLITTSSSGYDADMTKEIANPERIQSGTLDFSFVILFLLPLLLLVLLYNIKGQESEHGFLPLIFVQTGSKNWWLLSRTAFYTVLLLIVIFGLMVYGAMLTKVFVADTMFWNLLLWVTLYLFFWITLYFLILKYGKNTVSNTLQMVGVWLLFAFIIPATVQQWIAIEKPTNLMVDLIDVSRDKKSEINAQPIAVIDAQLFQLYPALKETKVAKDTIIVQKVRGYSSEALINLEMKKATQSIEADNRIKNELISKTYWYNPITYFQNKLNQLTHTDYKDYEAFRNNIRKSVDTRIKMMVFDTWNDITIDKEKYLEYNSTLPNNAYY
ncbi:hypothetical protein [Winogradskyella wichelsiae]|uniref:hypothetical protein n=1 Tax=Winogradskyella wichelsiae TaxID=2697007 RepID=UPI003EF2E3FF